MRTIVNATTLSDTLTQPTYLVYLGFNTPLFLSSAASYNWNSREWVEMGVDVARIAIDNVGRAKLSLTINNLDQQIGTLVLGEGVRDKEALVYVTYPAGSAGGIDPILLVDGVMDGASVGENVSMQVISRAAYYGSTPRVPCAPPVFNHLPPSGTILSWNGARYTLERQ